MIELAGARRTQHTPTEQILASNVEAFGKAMRKRLSDDRTDFAKRYLQALVDEIVINGDEATIRGSYDKLAFVVQKDKEGNLDQVPSLMCDWRARSDSNARPLGS